MVVGCYLGSRIYKSTYVVEIFDKILDDLENGLAVGAVRLAAHLLVQLVDLLGERVQVALCAHQQLIVEVVARRAVEKVLDVELVARYALHRLYDEVLERELAAVIARLLLDEFGEERRRRRRRRRRRGRRRRERRRRRVLAAVRELADRLLRRLVVVHKAYVGLDHRLFGELCNKNTHKSASAS